MTMALDGEAGLCTRVGCTNMATELYLGSGVFLCHGCAEEPANCTCVYVCPDCGRTRSESYPCSCPPRLTS